MRHRRILCLKESSKHAMVWYGIVRTPKVSQLLFFCSTPVMFLGRVAWNTTATKLSSERCPPKKLYLLGGFAFPKTAFCVLVSARQSSKCRLGGGRLAAPVSGANQPDECASGPGVFYHDL
eukprot:scaffold9272_cov195-Amphora_coffeaeformis.AAC.12